MLGLAAACGLWLCGLVSFVAADGHIEIVLPRRRTPPAGLHNLALWDLGPTIRASSYYGDWQSQHHPAFLVDGQWPSDNVQKWASADRDRHPWVEILWRENHNLERVVIRHAGVVEAAGLTADKEILVYCGTSREGSLLRFYLKHVAKYPNVRLYEGAWKEYVWLNGKSLPAETGGEPAGK